MQSFALLLPISPPFCPSRVLQRTVKTFASKLAVSVHGRRAWRSSRRVLGPVLLNISEQQLEVSLTKGRTLYRLASAVQAVRRNLEEFLERFRAPMACCRALLGADFPIRPDTWSLAPGGSAREAGRCEEKLTSCFSPFLNPEKCAYRKALLCIPPRGQSGKRISTRVQTGRTGVGRSLGPIRSGGNRGRERRAGGAAPPGRGSTVGPWEKGGCKGSYPGGSQPLRPEARAGEPAAARGCTPGEVALRFFLPEAPHASKFHCDKEGALGGGQAAAARLAGFRATDPAAAPTRGGWSGGPQFLSAGGGDSRLLSNRGGRSGSLHILC